MKIKSIKDVNNFINTVNSCKGDVWLQSAFGDRYNLKSALTQYLAIADLIRDKNESLELFAKLPEDEAILFSLFTD